MMNDRLRAAALLVLVVWLPGCYASNVVAIQDRSVVTEFGDLQWTEIRATELPGIYESVEVKGDAAASVWKIHYYFDERGRFAAAALVNGPDGPEFQALNGVWRLGPNGLALDDAPPVPIAKAEGHVRIAARTGAVILRRGELR